MGPQGRAIHRRKERRGECHAAAPGARYFESLRIRVSVAQLPPALAVIANTSHRSALVFFVLSVSTLPAADSSKSRPPTTYWDGAHLTSVRASHDQKDSPYKDVLKRVRKTADRALKRGPYSVMDK